MRKFASGIGAAILLALAGVLSFAAPASATTHNLYIHNSGASDHWIQVCYEHAHCRKLDPGKTWDLKNFAYSVGTHDLNYNKVTVVIVDAGSWRQRWDGRTGGEYGGCHWTGEDRVSEFQPSSYASEQIDYLSYERAKCRH
jgi:hypothetical protein